LFDLCSRTPYIRWVLIAVAGHEDLCAKTFASVDAVSISQIGRADGAPAEIEGNR
jgi:hypothetical protein